MAELVLDGLQVAYRGRTVVHGVDAVLRPSRIVGLIGESGSGKTSIGRVVAGLQPASAGRLVWREDVPGGTASDRRRARTRVQMVFQDPSLALNPLRTIDSVLRELLRRTRPRRSAAEREAALNDLLESVALTPELARRRPGHLSGGQRQRAAIARALAVDPEVLVADEPTSALDVSVQAEILELLDELARRQGLAIVLITHDLRVVERLADEVIVLEQGRVQEQGAVADVLRRPTSAYTRALIDAVPRLDGGAHR